MSEVGELVTGHEGISNSEPSVAIVSLVDVESRIPLLVFLLLVESQAGDARHSLLKLCLRRSSIVPR